MSQAIIGPNLNKELQHLLTLRWHHKTPFISILNSLYVAVLNDMWLY